MKCRVLCTMGVIIITIINAIGQDSYRRNASADVLHYEFNLILTDTSNIIFGEAIITTNLDNSEDPFYLDLIAEKDGLGMKILDIYEDSQKANFNYSDNKISIIPSPDGSIKRTYKVVYKGIAAKGLVIDKTKFGQRSFFGDNWPNLARHWLPCVDHPYDKASVQFNITAPEYYDVVATGRKIEESNLGNGMKLTSYLEPTPVAMKVVTIGVTKFASKLLEMVGDIPVTAWVYPENRLEGFTDFSVAVDVMKYFIRQIGPYPYAKLANMQAKTQWGGLENAGTIAYAENSVTGKNTAEGLIAHEIAHQWFGNSATENSWNHVWLSEGFATYFTILFQESQYGNEKRKEELLIDRQQIIRYYQRNPSPVVDFTIKDPRKVLSVNTYQKGGWVLNMLRHKLGDKTFWKGVQRYYQNYRDRNVTTEDFQYVMEEVSGVDLKDFFKQWVYTRGYPEIKWEWEYKNGHLYFEIEQVQQHHKFKFPLQIGIVSGHKMTHYKMDVSEKSHSYKIDFPSRPDAIVIDPEVWLLYEEK